MMAGHMISPVSRTPEMNLLSASVEGVRRGVEQATTASQSLANGELTPGNMVDLVEGGAVVKANAMSLRTSSEIVGTLLDTFA
jgi:hypothetical protein